MGRKKINNEILIYLSKNIRALFENITSDVLDKLTEIRIVNGGPIIVKFDSKGFYLCNNGISKHSQNAYIVSEDDMGIITELITKSSVYTYEKYINRGFVTLPGGHRVGIAGNCTVEKNVIYNVKEYNSFIFRIAREVPGASEIIFDEIFFDGNIKNTVIISPPACGKTTLLRDIARAFSNFNRVNRLLSCAIIDERYELAAVHNGKSSLDIGANNFVISGCVKSLAIPMVVRSMSPDIIIVDEMMNSNDFEAAQYALASGVKLIASVHGRDEYCNEMNNYNIRRMFEKIIILSNVEGAGTISKIIDGEKNVC